MKHILNSPLQSISGTAFILSDPPVWGKIQDNVDVVYMDTLTSEREREFSMNTPKHFS